MFSIFLRGRRSVAPALVVLASLTACNDGVTVSVAPPTFELTLGESNLTVARGSAAATFLRATRGAGMVGPIAYVVTGAPTGLAALVTATTVADSSTLSVVAAPTLDAGTYALTIHATALGALPQDVPVSVTVTVQTTTGDPEIASLFIGAHSCALTTTGAAYCWGYNANGQLGNNDTSLVNAMPVAVAGGLTFKSLGVSKVEDFTCGLTTSGEAYCWGENDSGQVGDGTTTRRLVPTRVAGGLTFESLTVGTNHVCALTPAGAAYCWGNSPNGAFGDGSVGSRLVPAPGPSGLALQSLVAGTDFTCGLTPGGTAYCWGLGVQGQLGNGSRAISREPVAVSGNLTFKTLAAGGQSVCGLTIASAVFCWGQNSFGTLGDGTRLLKVTPVAVAGGLTFATLSAGYDTMCGVTPDGTAYCWGYNFGQIGDGTQDARPVPTRVAGDLPFRSVAGGTGHTCGVTTTNAAYCWGDNSTGELGDGTTTEHDVPTPVRWR